MLCFQTNKLDDEVCSQTVSCHGTAAVGIWALPLNKDCASTGSIGHFLTVNTLHSSAFLIRTSRYFRL